MTEDERLYQTLSEQRGDLIDELIRYDYAISEIASGKIGDPQEAISNLCQWHGETAELFQTLGKIDLLLEDLDERIEKRDQVRKLQSEAGRNESGRSGEWFKNANYTPRFDNSASSLAIRQVQRIEQAKAERLRLRASAMATPAPDTTGKQDANREEQERIHAEMRGRYDRFA